MSRRTERVNELLRDALSALLRDELRDPRIGGLVSVTRVDVSPDLRRANAFVSVFGTDAERAGTMEALTHARPFLRRELSRRLRLRYTPDVEFISDTTIERAQEMTDLMRRNASERGEELR
jgi:ribosome-binding factor A